MTTNTGAPAPAPKQSAKMLKFFRHAHLPEKLAAVSAPVCFLAEKMIDELPEGPEKTAGLRKLLEAKDCFVRALLPDE